MISLAIRALRAAGSSVLKLARSAGKMGAGLAVAGVPLVALGTLGAMLLKKNDDVIDLSKKIRAEEVAEIHDERPVPKAELVVSDLTPPQFRDQGRLDVNYAQFDKDVDIEAVLEPIVLRVDLHEVKIKRITRYINNLHTRLVDLEDVRRQDKLAEKRYDQEEDVERGSRRSVVGDAVEKIGDVTKGLLSRLAAFLPLAGIGMAAAGLSYAEQAEAAVAGGDATFLQKMMNLTTEFVENQGGVAEIAEKIEDVAISAIGSAAGYNAFQGIRGSQGARWLGELATDNRTTAATRGATSGMDRVASAWAKAQGAVTGVRGKMPSAGNQAKTNLLLKGINALGQMIRKFSMYAAGLVDNVMSWARNLPPRIANVFFKGIKWVAKWGLIFTIVGNIGYNIFKYQTREISEEEMHKRNKEMFRQIFELFGGPFLVGFIFSIVGTVFALPLVGTTVGALAGIITGIILGDDIYRVLDLGKLSDALYDMVVSGGSERSALKAWASGIVDKAVEAGKETLQIAADKALSAIKSWSPTDTTMTLDAIKERYGDISDVDVIVQSRTGGFAGTNDENAVLGIINKVKTEEDWRTLQENFRVQTGEEITDYLRSFLSAGEYEKVEETIRQNIRTTNIEAGEAEMDTNEAIEYAVNADLYNENIAGPSVVNKEAMEEFVNNPSINAVTKIRIMESIITKDDITPADEAFLTDKINPLMVGLQPSAPDPTDVGVTQGVVERTGPPSTTGLYRTEGPYIGPPRPSVANKETVVDVTQEGPYIGPPLSMPTEAVAEPKVEFQDFTAIERYDRRFIEKDFSVTVLESTLKKNNVTLYNDIIKKRETMLYERLTGKETLQEIRDITLAVKQEVAKEYSEEIIKADAGIIHIGNEQVTELYKNYIEGPGIVPRSNVVNSLPLVTSLPNAAVNLSVPKERSQPSIVVLPVPQPPRQQTAGTTGSFNQVGALPSSPNRSTTDSFISMSYRT